MKGGGRNEKEKCMKVDEGGGESNKRLEGGGSVKKNAIVDRFVFVKNIF